MGHPEAALIRRGLLTARITWLQDQGLGCTKIGDNNLTGSREIMPLGDYPSWRVLGEGYRRVLLADLPSSTTILLEAPD